jgi:hypothetical protein
LAEEGLGRVVVERGDEGLNITRGGEGGVNDNRLSYEVPVVENLASVSENFVAVLGMILRYEEIGIVSDLCRHPHGHVRLGNITAAH